MWVAAVTGVGVDGKLDAAKVWGGLIAAVAVWAREAVQERRIAMAAKTRLSGRKGHSPGELEARTKQKREQTQIPCGNDKKVSKKANETNCGDDTKPGGWLPIPLLVQARMRGLATV